MTVEIDEPRMVAPDDVWEALRDELRAHRDAVKFYEAEAKRVADQIRTHLEEVGADGVDSCFKLRRTDRETIDPSALRERFPEIAQACTKRATVVQVVLL